MLIQQQRCHMCCTLLTKWSALFVKVACRMSGEPFKKIGSVLQWQLQLYTTIKKFYC